MSEAACASQVADEVIVGCRAVFVIANAPASTVEFEILAGSAATSKGAATMAAMNYVACLISTSPKHRGNLNLGGAKHGYDLPSNVSRDRTSVRLLGLSGAQFKLGGELAQQKETTMTASANPGTTHHHGSHCGHVAVRHGDHVDYLQDGHLHHPEGELVDEHIIEVSEKNPIRCTPEVRCQGHHHGPGCGHETVPHGDHIDYLVDGRLHHPHGDHCDDHGPLPLA